MSWQVDYTHAEILFSAKYMMISTVRGSFDKFTVNVNFNEADPTRSHVEVQIEADTINTKLAQRDEHLKSPDFLDAPSHPYLTFVSKRIEKIVLGHIYWSRSVMIVDELNPANVIRRCASLL